MSVLLVVVILVLLIVVHEFGHFLAAKLFGVKVIEFGVGYPPRALTFGTWGGTEYTLNWIPFGGFVRLWGDDDDGIRGKGTFIDAKHYKQAIILVAGVCGNIVAGWLLFAGAYHAGILHTIDIPAAGARLMITDIVAGSPADAAGLKEGDYLLDVNDAKGAHPDMAPEAITEFLSDRGGQDITLSYEHAGAKETAVVRPAHAVVPSEAQRPAIGVGLALVTAESVSWADALVQAAKSTYNTLVLVVKGVLTLLGQALRGAPNLQEVTGPIGLVGAVGEAAQNGMGYVLSLAAFISLNLAVINLIPIPALDGGRLVVVVVESVLRRKAPRLAIQLLNTVGIALIVLLMIAVTYQDIARLLV
ncbi:MAG TPA: M50 family metallopeptidase [Candidatus Paceibacterota bacterium]|nr:M50 family metallopeptidase [Candidatus Paceibacterota bacterium]